MPVVGRQGISMPGDIKDLYRQVSLAWYFALSDTYARYKHSVLGPFWLVLSTLIGIGGIAFIWGTLMAADSETFVPSLGIGLVLWQMISGSVSGAAKLFVFQATVIKNIKTPSWRLSLQLLFQQIINFAHNLVLVILLYAIFPHTLSPLILLAIPGFVLVLLNLYWVVQLLGFLGARYRDFDPLVTAVMPLLFFMSPVLFRGHELGSRAFLMKLNPMSYWINIIREPMLGSVPHFSDYLVSIAMVIVGSALAMWVTRAKSHRLAYWV